MTVRTSPDGFEPRFLQALRAIVGDEGLRTERAERWAYSYDNSRRQQMPAAIAVPRDEAQVCRLLRACHDAHVAVTVRGLGTGTAGAAVPECGGLVISSERMTRVEVDAANRVATAQPGATNGEVQRAAGAAGFFWPPDPTSADYSTIGGNLACNAAGPRAVKYGTPRENTLGLRAVTGDGTLLKTGCYTTKGVVGYDLTRLLIGSEGTLAVITEATLKLSPLPESVRVLRLVFDDLAEAAAAVSRIMAQPAVPRALEFADSACLSLIRNYSNADFAETARALLMVEVEGSASSVDANADAILAAAHSGSLIEARAARDEAEGAQLWQARKALSPALRTIAPRKINEDVVVPVSRMAEFVTTLQTIAADTGILIVAFGHAGNGNLHVNLLVDPDDPQQLENSEACLMAVFRKVLDLGGTLSGEHGIGYEKKKFVGLEIEPATLAMMRRIKDQFDPRGILNPGKIFPDDQAPGGAR